MIFGEGPIIKNIAGDLNKLFLQGTRAGQPINNVEGDAAADQATIQLMADRDPVIRDISTGLGWAGREVTVSGTGALQLVNSLGRPLKSWSVELAPYQEGSGDPSPENVRLIYGTDSIGIVTAGDNLLVHEFIQGSAISLSDYNRITSSILIPIESGKTYTFSASDYTNFYYVLNSGQNNRLPFPYIGGQYYWCGNSITWVQHDITFTATRSGYLAVVVRRVNESRILPADVSSVKMKFEESATSTPWTENAVATSITLPGTIYNGTVGRDGGEILWGEVDMGTLNWAYITNDGEPYFAAYVNETVPSGYEKMPGLNQICSCYKTASSTGTGSLRDMEIGATGSNNSRVFVKDSRFTDLSSFITFVTGKQLVYQLETPAQFTFTTPTIPTTEGDATIWITAEDGIVTSFTATYLQSE